MHGSEHPPLFPRDSELAIFQRVIAPFFLGLLVNYLLWGVQITQSYHYYKSYRKTDPTWLKSAVAVLFITDVVESICISHACWTFLVDGWGNLPKATLSPGWGFYATPLTGSFTASIVHFFYAQKIWTLLDTPYRYVFTASVIALSCTQLIGGIGSSIYMYATQITLTEFLHFETWSCVWLVTAAVTDIVIVIIMARKLSTSRTGFKKTDDTLSKLVCLTVETGFATAIVQIVDILVYLLWPLKTYHVVPALIAPKVYSNSMMSLLNSRKSKVTATLAWGTTQSDYLSQAQVGSISFRTGERTSLTVLDDSEPEAVYLAENSKIHSHDDQRNTTATESCVSSSSKQL